MIYNESDVKDEKYNINVEHITYGILMNLIFRQKSQNLVRPFFSFYIQYQEFSDVIL